MSKEDLDNSIYQKLLRFCSFQERCTSEVLSKCAKLDIDREEIDDYMAKLKDDGYLDDLRFAQMYTSGKFRINNWGRIKIKSKLYEKQLERSIIDQAIKSIDVDEYLTVIRKLISKRSESTGTRKEKDRMMRFLSSRGFEFEDVRKCLDEFEGDKNF